MAVVVLMRALLCRQRPTGHRSKSHACGAVCRYGPGIPRVCRDRREPAVRFGIFIYDGVEPIDLATYGVLSMARRIAPEIEICTIAPQAGPVALANGLKVSADFGIDNAPACDLVIVTGGPGWTAQAESESTLGY